MPINTRLLRVVIAQKAEPILAPKVRALAKLDLDVKKKMFLKEFDNHPVTQELQEGPYASSRFVPGGNLFSLLGFYASQNPVKALRRYLDEKIILKRRTQKAKLKGNNLVFQFPVEIPTLDEVNAAIASDPESKLEWTGRSFTDMIMNGIPGIPQYFFRVFPSLNSPPSRSGTAIQTKNKVASGSFRGTKYINELLRVFKMSISPRK